ncbi:hypothetical protein ACU610_09645 [Geodermatophilus sp. URMC 61]
MTDLGRRGIHCGPVTAEGAGAREAVATDPEGDTIALIEVAGA